MADPVSTEELGSGLLRTAARSKKYRPEYDKIAVEAAVNGEEPPPFDKWVAEKIQQEDSEAKVGVMQRLRKFVSK